MKSTFENDDLERHFYTVDEQGSTALITNQKADISNEYYYDAFGNVLQSKEEVHNRITYTGQQYDQITNQYYLRARFYNPTIGRFTQEDIYRGDGLNLYAYCKDNPVRYYDPSGYAKKALSDMSYDEIVAELNSEYEKFVKNKNKKYPKENNSTNLLPNELEYGPHGINNSLIGETGDNITGHHMPSNKYMRDKCDVGTNKAFSMFLEQVTPGKGGRHRRTFTYGLTSSSRQYELYKSLTPRDILAFDMKDVRRILIEDGVYDKDVAKNLNNYINDYKNSVNSNGVFDKENKLNEDSNRTKLCLKK